MRESLGGRLLVASSGGAPIAEAVLEFARHFLKVYGFQLLSAQVDIVNLYGSRETGGISKDGRVYQGVEIKLLSVPEMGYYCTANPPQVQSASEVVTVRVRSVSVRPVPFRATGMILRQQVRGHLLR